MKTRKRERSLKPKKILLIITGSIAAYKAGDLIRELKREGFEVTCILTKSAEKFITALTIRALSGNPVYTDMFDSETPYNVLHTTLADENDLILVAPASADFIARMAAGMADDLAACVILAARKPIILAPAMNDNMFLNPFTQRNMKSLQDHGCEIIEPVEGDLVCGRVAVGHVSDVDKILSRVKKAL